METEKNRKQSECGSRRPEEKGGELMCDRNVEEAEAKQRKITTTTTTTKKIKREVTVMAGDE
ncbi:unnamed protein product [Ceratitis capitata]|uniref:(Mediterranean fruit fly) hypothetical protein n=1 Tax=Ceratitis capitata TaxID=7213 RepID=A0A811UX92_CERCA|nr:unnamed protein product [Ceratitis capitata]